MIHVLARWRAQDGKISEVIKFIAEMATASRNEPGNKRYDVYQKIDDPHFILIDEEYLSEAAVQEHRSSPHFKNIVEAKIAPLLASRSSEKTEKK